MLPAEQCPETSAQTNAAEVIGPRRQKLGSHTDSHTKFNGGEKVSKSGLVNCVWRGARELSLTNV
ncbi:hypothetical protein DEO72_LG7g2373 [Vigna unguiculata]|uniref:Uncharacterized protein n=1 Tax=Vigna unguiculata TaxID=3917 RepID=A0A4D6MK75_VIGUN|nr:hypothetical protein DEO72_LG7g2373 [Vigna unguiculata]